MSEEFTTPEAAADQKLTVTDLIYLRNIIDIAAVRGAFKATELSGVGAVYDKLALFVNSVAAAVESADSDGQESTEESIEDSSEIGE